ncbi:hypothetical protein QE152_g32446 [Popillia japonica]|uniref:Uncharacterized protein n=1 Tax=Popillia japonica TaxID=7064 RepID=A0AAW1IZ31_POPJA
MILSSEISSTQLAQELVIDHLIGPLDLQHTERFNESPGRRVIKVPIYSLCFKLFTKRKKPSPNLRCENVKKEPLVKKVKQTKKRSKICGESESEEDDNYSIHDESDSLEEFLEETIIDKNEEEDPTQLEEKDYVLVRFVRKNVKHFVAQVTSRLEEDEYKVNYLKSAVTKQEDLFKFLMPDNPECSDVNIRVIILKLPKHIMHGGTVRTMSLMSFGIDFTPYNVS